MTSQSEENVQLSNTDRIQWDEGGGVVTFTFPQGAENIRIVNGKYYEPILGTVVLDEKGTAWQRVKNGWCSWHTVGYSWRELIADHGIEVIYCPSDYEVK